MSYRTTLTPRPAPSDAPRFLRLAAQALRSRDDAIAADLSTLFAILDAVAAKTVELEHEHISMVDSAPPLQLVSPSLVAHLQAHPPDGLKAFADALEERDRSLDTAITNYLDSAAVLAARLELLEQHVRELAPSKLS